MAALDFYLFGHCLFMWAVMEKEIVNKSVFPGAKFHLPPTNQGQSFFFLKVSSQ